jgi:hypothetical protein
MALRRIPQLDLLSGGAVAADDSFLVFDASASATKRITRPELAVAIAPNLVGVGLEVDGGGSLRVKLDTTPQSALALSGNGLTVGVGSTNTPFTGLRSRNTSTGNSATSALEVSTGLADTTVTVEVLNNGGAPIGRIATGAALATWQYRAAVHVFQSQSGTEYGRLSSAGFRVDQVIESTVGGFRFPDATVQTTAATSTPDASVTVAGKIELATEAEVNAGSDASRAVTPATLATYAPSVVAFAPGDRVLIADVSDANRLKLASLPSRELQRVRTQSSAYLAGLATETIPLDASVPLSGEGREFLSVTITPQSATSTFVIEVSAMFSVSANVHLIAALFRDNDASAFAVTAQYAPLSGQIVAVSFQWAGTLNTTAPVTIRLRAGGSGSAIVAMNGYQGAQVFGGTAASSITVTEIAA